MPETLELHLLACEHGDTILLRLPGGKWGLIDCNLRTAEMRDKFFNYLEKHKIDRLDYLFLTHPHQDHYEGMDRVAAHFVANGKGIGAFYDIGTDPREVLNLLKHAKTPRRRISSYLNLYRVLDKEYDKKKVEYESLNSRMLSTTHSWSSGIVELVPIGPKPGIVGALTRKAMAGENVANKINGLSVVLVVKCQTNNRKCMMLLAADAETDGIEEALGIWASRPENDSSQADFNVIKVPHHGSDNGHSEKLCIAKRGKHKAVAAISVGQIHGLPRRKVLSDYQNNGWVVMCTTKKSAKKMARTSMVDVFTGDEAFNYRQNDIIVKWSPGAGLKYGPEDAVVESDSLYLYT